MVPVSFTAIPVGLLNRAPAPAPLGVPLRSAAGKVAYLCSGGRSAYRNPADAMIAGIGNIERVGVCRRYPAWGIEPCLRRARRCCLTRSVCMSTDDVAFYQCADSRGGCVDAAKGISVSIDGIECITALCNEKRRGERCRGADAVCIGRSGASGKCGDVPRLGLCWASGSCVARISGRRARNQQKRRSERRKQAANAKRALPVLWRARKTWKCLVRCALLL